MASGARNLIRRLHEDERGDGEQLVVLLLLLVFVGACIVGAIRGDTQSHGTTLAKNGLTSASSAMAVPSIDRKSGKINAIHWTWRIDLTNTSGEPHVIQFCGPVAEALDLQFSTGWSRRRETCAKDVNVLPHTRVRRVETFTEDTVGYLGAHEFRVVGPGYVNLIDGVYVER